MIEPSFVASDGATQQAIGVDCAIVQSDGNGHVNVFAAILW
jgi:hypothetical protein